MTTNLFLINNSMSTLNTIMDDLKTAMKEKRKEELNILRMLNAAFKNKKIDLGNKDELSEEQILGVVKSEVKKRKDSVKAYTEGNREDLAEIEKREILVLEKYLPEQMPDKDLEKIIKDILNNLEENNKKNFGLIMKEVMSKTKGLADGGRISTIVKKLTS